MLKILIKEEKGEEKKEKKDVRILGGIRTPQLPFTRKKGELAKKRGVRGVKKPMKLKKGRKITGSLKKIANSPKKGKYKMGKPTKPCWVCGSNTWWQRPDGGWVCGKCHPNPNPDFISVSSEDRYSSEVLALRDRIRLGNDKLSKARFQIQEMQEGEEKERQWKRRNEAQMMLRHLCSELQIKGYRDCLYIEDGKRTKSCRSNPDGFECHGCPSTREYWVEELTIGG